MPSPSFGSLAPGQKHYDELAALYEIAALSATQAEQPQVVGEILRIVSELVAADQVLLFIGGDDDTHLEIYSARGSLEGAETRFPKRSGGVISRVFATRSGELVNDLTGDEPGDEMLKSKTAARQVVAVPLMRGENILGAVAGVNSRRGAFNEEDLRMLSILGDRVALTLENNRLVATLQRQVRELEGLQRLSKLLISGENLESVIGSTVQIVKDLVGCEKIAVFLYDQASNSLQAHEPVVGITQKQLEDLCIPLSEPSMGGTVFRTNTALFSNDAPNDAWVNQRLRQLLDMKSLLVVPVTTGPKPLGILKAVNATKGYFDEEDVSYASLLGRQVGSVIETNQARARERTLVRELKEADRTKSEFVSMLAHELKGPMTTVLGFSHTLKEQWTKIEDDKRNQVLDIIHKEVGRLSRLVNDLLDVSRMEAGTLRYDLEPASLQDVVDSILIVHTSLRSDHAVLDQIPADLPKVLVDKDRVRQVIINLLTNAIRYSPEKTTVTIGADVIEESGERFVRLSVHDEGIGISPHDTERIFTKFAMLAKPGWTKKGTGLGLYITKGIVEAHGGRIWVESDVGRGSTFYVTMRVAGDESSA